MTEHDYWYAIPGHEVREYINELGVHPTRSLGAVSHLVRRPKLFRSIVKERILSYHASTDPIPGSEKAAPTVQCPHCDNLSHAPHGLRRHCIKWRPEAEDGAELVFKPVAGVKPRITKAGKQFASPTHHKQRAAWDNITGTKCPVCKLQFTDIDGCRRHWSNACSKPDVQTCRGCKLILREKLNPES